MGSAGHGRCWAARADRRVTLGPSPGRPARSGSARCCPRPLSSAGGTAGGTAGEPADGTAGEPADGTAGEPADGPFSFTRLRHTWRGRRRPIQLHPPTAHLARPPTAHSASPAYGTPGTACRDRKLCPLSLIH